ncbi:Hydrolase-4 domain-containing protein [Mycena kentingensis (nom. inval.)]|nr:Hydrolase-4 domain-containing protein [Mycena kentingensis (nom. inval.)]
MSIAAGRYLTHLAYILPSVVAVAVYALRATPISTNELPCPADPGLGSRPTNSRARILYKEDWTEGGSYVTLPLGTVRYWLDGPESGRKVILIHGLTTPSVAFERLVPMLVDAGCRVLAYDLYGRGYSDAPRAVAYDTNLYVTQLALLMQCVGWSRAHLVGFSMGGAIASAFVASFPHLVEDKIILIASAGAGRGEKPVPLAGYRHFSFVHSFIVRRFLKSLPPKESSSGFQMQLEFLPLQVAELAGYKRAVASSLLEGPITRMHWAWQSKNWVGKKALLIHGTRDAVVPPAASNLIRDILQSHAKTQVQLVEVEGAGHDLTWTNTSEVGAAIVGFLRG